MGFISRLFGGKESEEPSDNDHTVIACFQYGQTDLEPLFEVERQLEAAIEKAGVGEFDGNEIAVDGSDGSLFMYGPDADKLFEAVKPVLESADCLSEVVVRLWYGPLDEDDVKQKEVRLSG